MNEGSTMEGSNRCARNESSVEVGGNTGNPDADSPKLSPKAKRGLGNPELDISKGCGVLEPGSLIFDRLNFSFVVATIETVCSFAFYDMSLGYLWPFIGGSLNIYFPGHYREARMGVEALNLCDFSDKDLLDLKRTKSGPHSFFCFSKSRFYSRRERIFNDVVDFSFPSGLFRACDR